MKKILAIALFAMFCIADMQAQSSSSQQFHNGVIQFLKEEGFVPTIDDDDKSINFKREGTLHWIFVEDDGPFYIEFHRAGLSISDADRKIVLESCNYANRYTRCGKAIATEKSVTFGAEYYVTSLEEFKKTFYNYIRVLNTLREKTIDYYNEHDK